VSARPGDTLWRQPLRARACLLGGLIACLGCPRPAPEIPTFGGVPAPQLLASVAREAAAHQQAVGATRIDYLASDGFFRGDADIAAARRALLRVELRSFFGQPAYAVAADGEQFVFIDNLASAAIRGPVSSPRLGQLLPLPLPADVTVALLLGALPPLPEGTTRYAPPPEGSALALEHQTEQGIWRFGLGEKGEPLMTAALSDRAGAEQLAVRYTDHRAVGGVTFPHAGEVRASGRAGAVRWRWREVEVNGEALPAEVWTLTVPPGYRLENAGL